MACGSCGKKSYYHNGVPLTYENRPRGSRRGVIKASHTLPNKESVPPVLLQGESVPLVLPSLNPVDGVSGPSPQPVETEDEIQ